MFDVPPLPHGQYVRIANMIGQLDVLESFEKTAEISQRLYERKSAIVDSFAKISGLGGLARGLWGAAKSLGPTAQGVGSAAKAVGGAALPALKNAGTMALNAAKANPMTSTALGTAGAAYGLHRLSQPAAPQVMKYAEAAFRQGGADLARAVNSQVNLSGLEKTLEKLGAIGELNAKLQIAIDSSDLSDLAKYEATKLGSENSALCLETLQEIVKYASDYGTSPGQGERASAVAKHMSGRASGGFSMPSMGDSLKTTIGKQLNAFQKSTGGSKGGSFDSSSGPSIKPASSGSAYGGGSAGGSGGSGGGSGGVNFDRNGDYGWASRMNAETKAGINSMASEGKSLSQIKAHYGQ